MLQVSTEARTVWACHPLGLGDLGDRRAFRPAQHSELLLLFGALARLARADGMGCRGGFLQDGAECGDGCRQIRTLASSVVPSCQDTAGGIAQIRVQGGRLGAGRQFQGLQSRRRRQWCAISLLGHVVMGSIGVGPRRDSIRRGADGCQARLSDARHELDAILLLPVRAGEVVRRRALLNVALLEQAVQHRPAGGDGQLIWRRGDAKRVLGGLGEDAAGSVGEGHQRVSGFGTRSAGCYRPEPRREAGRGGAPTVITARDRPFALKANRVKRVM